MFIAAERPMRPMMIVRDNYDQAPDPSVDPEGYNDWIVRYTTYAVGPESGPIRDAAERYLNMGAFITSGLRGAGRLYWTARLLAPSGATATVIATPHRCLCIADPQPDKTGPMAFQDEQFNRALVLPDDKARTQFITLRSGESVDIGRLTGKTVPQYPEEHHIWEIILTDPNLQPIAS